MLPLLKDKHWRKAWFSYYPKKILNFQIISWTFMVPDKIFIEFGKYIQHSSVANSSKLLCKLWNSILKSSLSTTAVKKYFSPLPPHNHLHMNHTTSHLAQICYREWGSQCGSRDWLAMMTIIQQKFQKRLFEDDMKQHTADLPTHMLKKSTSPWRAYSKQIYYKFHMEI